MAKLGKFFKSPKRRKMAKIAFFTQKKLYLRYKGNFLTQKSVQCGENVCF